jgi:predicted amidohydrolase
VFRDGGADRCFCAAEVRPPLERRTRHRRAERDQRGRDVAIANGKVAAVAANIAPADAFKVVDATGYYVTPGLVDIHVHVYAGTGERGSYAGDNSLYPDGFTLRSGVTTVVDAGSSGWRSFRTSRIASSIAREPVCWRC